ncbi:iron chaperone [Flavobacterium suzhouense]|uniref:Iron chaperone n=1 Tax=Flavobacterium suzhouense TaxID=1529638 RepID=A0ABW5NS71_9FLAO
MDKPKHINEYIAGFTPEVQKLLEQVRQTVQKTAPDAEESISYGMPAFKLNGNLVYFAAFTNHIGFYALPSGNEAFQKEISNYKTGKGSIQFPFDKPLPLDLIAKIVKFRVEENIQKSGLKKKK